MSKDPPLNRLAPAQRHTRKTAAAVSRGAQLLRLSSESACPYLPERWERKLWTVLDPTDRDGFAALNRAGFRRSGRILYRPACAGCEACRPTRVPAASFAPSRTQRRIMKRNADLSFSIAPPRATSEHFALFSRYVDARHWDGGMAGMQQSEFAQMVEDAPDGAALAEWRDRDGLLCAGCILDDDGEGLSAVYSYFDPDAPKRSLGVFVVVSLLDWARRIGRAHLYLGYTIVETHKMAYKQSFRPAEHLAGGVWRRAGAEDETVAEEA
ncbi:MAG: arginyltransferase [Pseudomonadota bacterium]